MLQRIQTVYLLIIVALTVATLFLPLAVLQQGDALFSFDASGLSTMIGITIPGVGLICLDRYHRYHCLGDDLLI